MKINDEFIHQVYAIVNEIPLGKVTTYGEIAKLSGYDNNSRLVGRVLSMAGLYGDYPCHRVVNASGKLVDDWPEQKELLLAEGIILNEKGKVNLKKYKWLGE